jgi:regulator of replication initiation timing
MDPLSELEKEKTALLAERAALRRKVRALENKNAVLQAREAELERWLAENPLELAATAASDPPATNLEGAPLAKGQPDPDACD